MAGEPKDSGEKESLQEKFSKKVHSVKENEKVGAFLAFAKENTLDTVAYFLMVVGLILLFTHPFAGSILVGIVYGYYFSDEIVRRVQGWQQFVEKHGTVRSLLFAGTLLALFIRIPMFFVAAFIVAGLKYLIISDRSK